MKNNNLFALMAMTVAVIIILPNPVLSQGVDEIYQEHCASCHGDERFGGMGPALLPGNLGRLKKKQAESIISSGLPATQMPGFADKISPEQINQLVELVYSEPKRIPKWGIDKINESHTVFIAEDKLPKSPIHNADLLNLFVVVESGDHHVTILDGDKFEPLARFESHYALHGGAKFSPDGRFVYFGSRDGWVTRHDLYNFETIAETRVGINLRNIAVSSDGRFVMAANYLPNTLVLMNAKDLSVIKIFDIVDGDGKSSRASAVYNAPPRESFLIALKDIPEIWEIPYMDNPKPVAKGLVHNYKPGQLEGEFDFGPFPVRRIKLDDYLDDFFFDQEYRTAYGAARNAKMGQVVNLNVGRKVGDLELSSMPHLGSGITFEYQGKQVLATPHLSEGAVSVIDMQSFKTIKRIETMGPGFFMRGHENSPYAWVDVFFGPNKDVLHVIDMRTLEIVKTINPAPGKTNAHVEFDRDGSHALVSVWEMDGWVVVYDAITLEEVKRIPMKKPVGKYNVFNKINYSSGTSH
ncbi:MAG: c-type cytochrome [Rhodospirillaceae bacterium]|nr:c-type cytochrome [Rhodospirillaceae bacterium]